MTVTQIIEKSKKLLLLDLLQELIEEFVTLNQTKNIIPYLYKEQGSHCIEILETPNHQIELSMANEKHVYNFIVTLQDISLLQKLLSLAPAYMKTPHPIKHKFN